jgi:hypothetical protein
VSIAFNIGRIKHNPKSWIKSTIDITVNSLIYRKKILEQYHTEDFKVFELITRELLGRNIWKYSEAYGKFKGCPFWSIDALKLYETSKNKSLAKVANKLRHEHTYPQILLINKLKNLEEINYKVVENLFKKYAVATVVTKEENEKLNSRDVGLRTATISDDNIWLRYNNKKFKIKIAMNRSKNLFFEYHKKDMLNAMVL